MPFQFSVEVDGEPKKMNSKSIEFPSESESTSMLCWVLLMLFRKHKQRTPLHFDPSGDPRSLGDGQNCSGPSIPRVLGVELSKAQSPVGCRE